MHSDIEALLVQAENHFLKPEELATFKRYVTTLGQRLKIYEFLREKEAIIFQPIINQLEEVYPSEKPEVLERSLKHWILVLRYAAMAMLLNDPTFLKQRLLDWLSGLVQVQQTLEIEETIYQLLQASLKKVVPEKALAILEPFLKQAQSLLTQVEA